MNDHGKMDNIFPSWKVKRLIGSGSYGKVYELERIEHDAVYRSAMKVISIPQNESEIKTRLAEGEDPRSVSTYYNGVARSLLTENRVMAELKGNSNIVSYEDHQVVDHDNGIGCDIFIRMELLTSFIDFMAANRITEDTVISLGIDICKALEICENKSIIHRDIKPGNIFVSDTGDFKLGDFGIARTIDKTTGGLSKKGTYRYMAPEVYKGEAYGRTVDICSLGLVMYYLMNGNRTPFLPEAPNPVNYDDEENALIRRMNGERIMPPKYASNGLASIILKACSYNPAERYQSASQMRGDLERLKAGNFRGVTGSDPDLTVADPAFAVMGGADAPGTQGRTVGATVAGGGSVNTFGGTANSGRTARPGTFPGAGSFSGSGSVPGAGTVPGVANAPGARPVAGASVGPAIKPGPGRRIDDRKKKIAIVAAAAIAVVVIGICAAVMLSGSSGGGPEGGGEETTQAVEAGPVAVDTQGIEVLYTDIDWDSRSDNKNNGKYFDTDIILRVHNGSAENIIDMEISGTYKGGAALTNLEGDGEADVIHVSGYIPAGTTGIMTCGITAPKARKGEQLDAGSIIISSARTNHAMAHYEVPKGHVKEHNGAGDYYNVQINNNNGVEVNESAKLVAVIDNDAKGYFDEADATGRLSQNIPANSTYQEKAAFVDPNFHVDFSDIIVYVIDSDYYESAR